MVGAFENLDCSEDISAVTKCDVDVTLADGTVVATQQVYVVKIGNTWYIIETECAGDEPLPSMMRRLIFSDKGVV